MRIKKIVRYWNLVGDAAVECVMTGSRRRVWNVSFFMEKDIFFIQLPSGRRLSYLYPTIRDGKFGSPTLRYMGMDQTTKKWKQQETYGGKLVENIVQATARDLLADAMLRVDAAGYKIVMHVHDEIVCEMPDGEGSLEELNKIMSTPIAWAKGLPLAADGFETKYYKKD